MPEKPPLDARYALPDSPHMAAVEACFASGMEPWTTRAVSRLDKRFARGADADAGGGEALRLTCQRLEQAFRKACAGRLKWPAAAGGLTDAEFSDWVLYGVAYVAAREAAFRVLLVRLARAAGP